MQRLLVNVRGPIEADEAAKGGAHIVDIMYPATSETGTPYPLNILSVRGELSRYHPGILISTNVGETQIERSTVCQAALGVATAGADIIRCSLAELSFEAAAYLGDSIVRTVKKFYPQKKVVPVLFMDRDMQRFLKPLEEGSELLHRIKADGILISVHSKLSRKSLLDFLSPSEIMSFTSQIHQQKKEVWIAGRIGAEDLPELWKTGIDVICVRQAACEIDDSNPLGNVKAEQVKFLVNTIPANV